jgi:hypothetical protein
MLHSLYRSPSHRLFLRGRDGNGFRPALRTQPACRASGLGFAEAHCLQAAKAENTPAAFLESVRGISLDKSPDALAINRNPL